MFVKDIRLYKKIIRFVQCFTLNLMWTVQEASWIPCERQQGPQARQGLWLKSWWNTRKMTSYWTEVGGDFVLQWLLFILKIVHQPELWPQKVKEYWVTNGGGRQDSRVQMMPPKGPSPFWRGRDSGGGEAGPQRAVVAWLCCPLFTCLSVSFTYEGKGREFSLV